MTKRMLIDASHPEETRVVVVHDHQLEDFDFESSTKKQLKGNIYLAKVTRVEPSLQAAFVDYGGQRHGFLAFSEIHPDYYQIPQADRKLLQEPSQPEADPGEADGAADEALGEAAGDEAPIAVSTDPDEEAAEVFDEQARQRSRLLRGYKIQEVIKRRQIMLVQVVKEERGNKGAALTTYLSLAGRYSVLMPNTGRGGGISRKIANPADRARLKAIAREIEVPEGMGLIIRTAGQQRSKLEIRRDYEYSLRLWNDIRELTLRSVAPCTIHEEGALVKRAIRDLYSRDVDEVWVEGEEGYRTAKKVMSMLMPSRTRRVKLYKDELPLFHRHGVEEQLDSLHQPLIHLKSGASIVIHTTEALTAIDVNSGRSTRERNIEETALKTNLEAAEEIARQLRLRDIAGLVVIDFIDMAEMRNQRAVERRLREHLKSDRARVQLGRISAFGLLELSRQRLRPSFQELSTQLCPTCGGSGAIRSVESAALQALRVIELEGIKGKAAALAVTLPLPVALYMLNQKRDRLIALEQRYDMSLDIGVDEELIAGAYEVESTAAKLEGEAPEARVEAAVPEALAGDGAAAVPAAAAATEDDGEAGRKRRRRRRRRRKPGDGDGEAESMGPAEARAARAEPALPAEARESAQTMPTAPAPPEPAPSGPSGEAIEPASVAAEKEARKPRRARRRGTAKRGESRESVEPAAANGPMPSENGADRAGAPEPGWRPAAAAADAPAPQPVAAPRPDAEEPAGASSTAAADAGREARPAQPERTHERLEESEAKVPSAAVVDPERPAAPRRGWWNRFVRKDE
jgi:ribonuclease E